MSVIHPIPDMLTRIRNANMRGAKKVVVTHSKFVEGVATVLKEEGYIGDYKVITDEVVKSKKWIHIYLKYGKNEEKLISGLKLVSKPGKRVFRAVKNVEKVLDGLGMSILSTHKGIMSDKKATKLNVGGEVICRVW